MTRTDRCFIFLIDGDMGETVSEFYARGRVVSIGPWRVWVRISQSEARDKLLLLHGFPTGSYDWVLLWEGLCANFSVLAFDMLGFGRSDRPVGHKYSCTEQAVMTCDLLKLMKWDGPLLVLAHDYGISVFQELLARSAIALKRGIMLNGGIDPDGHRPRMAQALLAWAGPIATPLVSRTLFRLTLENTFAKRPSRALMESFIKIVYDEGEFVVPSLLEYMRERRRCRDRWMKAFDIHSSKLWLVWGDRDPIAGNVPLVLHSRPQFELKIEWIDGTGHYPQWEASECTLRAILTLFML